MHDIVAYTRARVRDDRPVHLLGIGGVRDIFHGVRHGIDTFDCVHPSRLARHGGALGKILLDLCECIILVLGKHTSSKSMLTSISVSHTYLWHLFDVNSCLLTPR